MCIHNKVEETNDKTKAAEMTDKELMDYYGIYDYGCGCKHRGLKTGLAIAGSSVLAVGLVLFILGTIHSRAKN